MEGAITTIKQKLAFLIDLSNEERKALPKMGNKSRAFVSKALEVATQNSEFLPRSFDLEEMRKDVQNAQIIAYAIADQGSKHIRESQVLLIASSHVTHRPNPSSKHSDRQF
ncbi:hypothetical protein NIES4106_10450 [Fischerella sp. NIES-4106]|nr:hypothetical protein NIES4106_10450 [Fischerella sp. NIES-4106]